MKHCLHSLLCVVCCFCVPTIWLSCSKSSTQNKDYVNTSHYDGLQSTSATVNSTSGEAAVVNLSEYERDFQLQQNSDVPVELPSAPQKSTKKPSGKFQIIAGNYLEEANATAAVERLKAMGFPISWHDHFINSPYHTVIVQYTFTMAEAQAIAKHLRKEGIESYVNEKRSGPETPEQSEPFKDQIIPAPESIAESTKPKPKVSEKPDPNFDNYVDLYNVILAEHMLMWQERSKELYNKDFESLTFEEQKEIRKSIPVVFSDMKMFDEN